MADRPRRSRRETPTPQRSFADLFFQIGYLCFMLSSVSLGLFLFLLGRMFIRGHEVSPVRWVTVIAIPVFMAIHGKRKGMLASNHASKYGPV